MKKEKLPFLKPGRKDFKGSIAQKPDLSGKHCNKPWEWLEVGEAGAAWCCCPSWLPVSIGNIKRQTIQEVWDGESLKKIRDSITDGSFKYCDHIQCPMIQGDLLPDKPLKVSEKVSNAPKYYNLCYDDSCNLSCPSCRTHKILHKVNSKKRFEAERIHVRMLNYILKQPSEVVLNITGAGDALGSPMFREFLMKFDGQKHPNVYFNLQTNGVMLTPRYWKKLHRIHDNIRMIMISVDAASKEVYNVVRKGGDFELLRKNIEHVASQNLDERFKLRIDFVVQQRNYHEISRFIDYWGWVRGITGVAFSLVTDWGTWDKNTYEQQCIWKTSHPEHEKFLEELSRIDFSSDNVELGNVRPYYEKSMERIED